MWLVKGGGGGSCWGCLGVYALLGEEGAAKDFVVFYQETYQ